MAAIKNDPVNLLALDGGGVRGLCSLLILDEVMRKIQHMYRLEELPKPCEFFDMIAGTSTGGLIAIMLGRLRMSTREAIQEYDNCSSKIFSKANKKSWSVTERFRATALQEVVEDVVKKRGRGERMWDAENQEKGKVIVCVLRAADITDTRTIRSFPGDQGEDEQWDKDILIWEAARATTAASSFFKPQKLGKGTKAEYFVDAAIGANNPLKHLLQEAEAEFGTGRRLGCVVSIGTGTRDVKLGRAVTGLVNFLQAPGYYIGLVNSLKTTATDAEKSHRELQAKLLPFTGSYFRFNVPKAAEQVGLAHYQKAPLLKSLTAEYLAVPEIVTEVRKLAESLKTDGFHHGLTVGLITSLDKEQVILSSTATHRMGIPTSFFTGRQDILQRLDSIFCPRNTGGKPRRECLLHGMGGVGKTEIALKAGELFEERFKYIFFIDGTMPSTVCQSYAEICRQYKLGNGSTQAMQDLAMRWLEGLTEEWLMVFDDCNLSDRQGHLPGRGRGNVIYTSRTTELRQSLPADCVIEVTPFGKEDAVELLLKASGSGGAPSAAQNTALAKKIVKELEYLPLAIHQAAAAVRDGISLDDYLHNLRRQKVGIPGDPHFKDQSVENKAVFASLELSYEAIMSRRRRWGRQFVGRSATLALKLLWLLCFYHHKAFPMGALGRAATARSQHSACPLRTILDPPDRDFDLMLCVDPDGSWNMLGVLAALKVLETFSLIKYDRDRFTVSMHVLVQQWARHRLDKGPGLTEDQRVRENPRPRDELYLRYSLLARIILSESIILSPKLTDKSFARTLSPHVSVCLRCRSKPLAHEVYDAHLQLKIGWLYYLNKSFYQAEEVYLKCLRVWKIEFGHVSWKVMSTLLMLGQLYREMGRLGDAELAFLEIRDMLHWGMDDWEAAASGQQTERDLNPQMPPSPALPRHSPTTLIKRLPRPKHFSEPTFGWLREVGRRKSASNNGGADGSGQPDKHMSPETAKTNPSGCLIELDDLNIIYCVTLAELARVYLDQHRYGLAIDLLRKAATRLEELVTEDDQELQRIQDELKKFTDPGDIAFWSKRLKDWEKAAKQPGTDYAEYETGVLIVAANADCWLRNHKYDTAYKMYCKAYKSFERIYGPYDRKVLEILRRMVICKVESDQCDKAIEIATECLARARRVYGECHQETVLALEKLWEANFYRTYEEDDYQEMLLREAVDRAEGALGLTHPITKRMRQRLTLATHDHKKPMWHGVKDEPDLQLPQREPTLDALWQSCKAALERFRARGAHQLMIKRWERLVAYGPPRTRLEHCERMIACFGPQRSLVETYHRVLDQDAKPADEDLEPSSVGLRGCRPSPDICICGEPDHAEGSRWHESLESETENFSNEDCAPEDTGDGVELQSTMAGVPRAVEGDLEIAEGAGARKRDWRNVPLHLFDIVGL